MLFSVAGANGVVAFPDVLLHRLIKFKLVAKLIEVGDLEIGA